jgi:hypothetical protein
MPSVVSFHDFGSGKNPIVGDDYGQEVRMDMLRHPVAAADMFKAAMLEQPVLGNDNPSGEGRQFP